MRARRSQVPSRDDHDGFDLPPPEVFDAPPEAPVDEVPTEPVEASAPSLGVPVHVCLVCGDDPAIDSGCQHLEVARVDVLPAALHRCLAGLRAQHGALRERLRTLRRLAGAAVAAGEASVELRESPALAPRVVLIPPPPAKRPRRGPCVAAEQGRFGFVEPTAADDEGTGPDRG